MLRYAYLPVDFSLGLLKLAAVQPKQKQSCYHLPLWKRAGEQSREEQEAEKQTMEAVLQYICQAIIKYPECCVLMTASECEQQLLSDICSVQDMASCFVQKLQTVLSFVHAQSEAEVTI